jgi:hypothetical protein
MMTLASKIQSGGNTGGKPSLFSFSAKPSTGGDTTQHWLGLKTHFAILFLPYLLWVTSGSTTNYLRDM